MGGCNLEEGWGREKSTDVSQKVGGARNRKFVDQIQARGGGAQGREWKKMGAGGRETSIGADLKKSYKRSGFGAQGSKKRKGRWGL